jgi:hypothetical protein
MTSIWIKAREINYKLHGNRKHVTDITDLTLFTSFLLYNISLKVTDPNNVSFKFQLEY